MKKLLILAFLAPLLIGAAPPEANQNTIEFWGGNGQYRRDAGCGHYQKVKYYYAAVRYKHKVVEETEYLNDSGKVYVKRKATPFSVILDASYTRGTAADIDYYYYDGYNRTQIEETVEYIQASAKLQADGRALGLGLGMVAAGDDGGLGVAPAVLLRVWPLDKIYLTGEFFYANPLRSGHGFFAAGLGHQSKNLELWAGAGCWMEDLYYSRPCLTVKYHFGDMLLGVDASYGTSVQDGVRPYSVSLGVGYEF